MWIQQNQPCGSTNSKHVDPSGSTSGIHQEPPLWNTRIHQYPQLGSHRSQTVDPPRAYTWIHLDPPPGSTKIQHLDPPGSTMWIHRDPSCRSNRFFRMIYHWKPPRSYTGIDPYPLLGSQGSTRIYQEPHQDPPVFITGINQDPPHRFTWRNQWDYQDSQLGSNRTQNGDPPKATTRIKPNPPI